MGIGIEIDINPTELAREQLPGGDTFILEQLNFSKFIWAAAF